MINKINFGAIFAKIKKTTAVYDLPVLEKFNTLTHSPYWVLIACILSLRAKDEMTDKVVRDLYSRAKTPQEVLAIPSPALEKILYRTGFYKVKTRNVINITNLILEKYKGIVPSDLNELLTIQGIGRKTANLVVTVAFNKYGICVDTHVHKICNRWGYVKTKTPDKTELRLREILPKKYWKGINMVLVLFGQHICLSVSPLCSKCPIVKECPKLGVGKHR